jgi:hypothetical protein
MIAAAGRFGRDRARLCPQELQDVGAGNLKISAKNSFRITRETRFLKKAGFPDLSGKTFYHMDRLH